MPYAPKQKEKSRQRILQSARKLFNRHGFEQVTIDQIMAGAGLTRGAFYAHFGRKEELYAEAVSMVLADTRTRKRAMLRTGANERDVMRSFVDLYLGSEHLANVDRSCPMASLPGDVARGGDGVKGAFRDVLDAMVSSFKENLLDGEGADERAYAITTLCVGGMVLARASGDEHLAKKILGAAHLHAVGLLTSEK